MPKVIALSGYARSGKDTVADFLVSDHGFEKVSFADPMRQALAALNPRIEVEDEGFMPLQEALYSYTWEELKKIAPEVRGLLQRFGTEVGREMFGEHVWINLAIQAAQALLDQGKNVVFTDTRFRNEAESVFENLYGQVWRIERPGVGPANDHASEIELATYPYFDRWIFNDGDLNDLSWKVANTWLS